MSNPIQVNTILHTRDGRKIGNAIVVEIIPSGEYSHELISIVTDYGNTCGLSHSAMNFSI